ncbi:MAG: peptide chain release factor N(5)-glutamine methyltransferase, partial [Ignavibacteriaceae bacterium]|nr:peptide chain release factor N(5)-glutamine methyltransferase [Ignavibacteriaceae bacterium]
LIPRQETEILIETILNQTDKETNLNILDIGTGSGIIAVLLAHHLPNAKIIAVDKSPDALTIAKKNAETHNVAQRITFREEDVLNSTLQLDEKLDIIVSNPPYVSQKEFASLQKEIVDHEPDYAVTDFSDGLTFYRKIIETSPILLNENAKVFFEVGAGQSEHVKSIFESNNFSSVQIWKDYANIDRVVKGEWK